jgi:pectate lyase
MVHLRADIQETFRIHTRNLLSVVTVKMAAASFSAISCPGRGMALALAARVDLSAVASVAGAEGQSPPLAGETLSRPPPVEVCRPLPGQLGADQEMVPRDPALERTARAAYRHARHKSNRSNGRGTVANSGADPSYSEGGYPGGEAATLGASERSPAANRHPTADAFGVPRRRLAALLLLALVASAGACRDVNVDPLRRVTGVPAGSARVVVGNSTCPSDLLGSATVMGSTTGGGTAAPVTVTTLADLIAYAGRAEPTTIRMKGMISVPPGSQPSQILVGSNKTIVGADMQSGLTGGGFLIRAAQNVIVRNLVIARPVGTDGIAVRAARHVWIDHCEFYSDTKHSINYYGWLVDITHGSDFVTVSWTWFHDHFKTVQVGHSDRNGIEDTKHLTVTLHHNLFQGTVSGARVQFGSVHIFNNHYQNIRGYAIASLNDARVVAEENVFDNVAVPLTTEHESSTGPLARQIEDLGNICYPSCAKASRVN